MADLIPERESRPPEATRLAPVGWEDRAVDVAAAALADIGECDGCALLVKWEEHGGVCIPVLFVLWTKRVPNPDGRSLPHEHLGPDGILRPAHRIGLALLPRGELMTHEQIRRTVRNGIESYLLAHGIRPYKIPA